MEDLYNYVNPLNKQHSPMISKETLDIVLDNKAVSHNWPGGLSIFITTITALTTDTVLAVP